MNYTFVPTKTLEHTALVEISSTLLIENAKEHFRKICCSIDVTKLREEMEEIENIVIEKVQQHFLPKLLKEKIIGCIKPMGLQLLRWMQRHLRYFSSDCPLSTVLNKLRWTSEGTVDQRKTAEVIIKDNFFDICKRFRLACIYCFENDILELWNKLPEYQKRLFGEKRRKFGKIGLEIFWAHAIKGELSKLDNMIEEKWHGGCSRYQFAFEYAAIDGNKVSTEHFLRKLTLEERRESLVKYAIRVARKHFDEECEDFNNQCYAEVLRFLLSQMDEEQEKEMFKRCPYEILRCFLDWPLQNLFTETANRMWDFLSEEHFDSLLRDVNNKVELGYTDYDYQGLLRTFWRSSPDSHKKFAKNEAVEGDLLSDLFINEDIESVKLIFKDSTVKEKEEYICNDTGLAICYNFISDNRWKLLLFFIRECVPSKSVLIRFKDTLIEHYMPKSWEYSETENDQWDEFFQLFDDLAREYDEKRKIEDGISGPDEICITGFKEEASK